MWFLIVALLAMSFIAYGTADNRWYKVVSVKGGSMAPTIERGDLMVVTRPGELAIGDVVVFQVDQEPVTHRIVGIEADGSLITQGDANPTPDRWRITEQDVVGVYRFRIPLLGHLFTSGVGAWFTDSEGISATVGSGLPLP